jgi:hypothetical protein
MSGIDNQTADQQTVDAVRPNIRRQTPAIVSLPLQFLPLSVQHQFKFNNKQILVTPSPV